MIVPSQCETVHGLLDPPLLVDDPCVVGDEEIEKLLPSLIALQTVNGETCATIMLKICPA
jgi:hypothetical protein